MQVRGALALLCSSFVILAAVPSAVAGGDKDKDAEALYTTAIDVHFLALELGKAETTLREALKSCGKDGCTKPVLAKLRVGLAAVYLAEKKPRAAEAEDELVTALGADPKLVVPKDFDGPDMKAAFEAAKKRAGGGAAKPPPKHEPVESGDLELQEVKEQLVSHPIPIFVKLRADFEAKTVTLRFKPYGAGTKWKALEMAKIGKGWGAEIPCEDVGVTGDVKYYVVADGDGEEASSGSKKQPHVVRVLNQIEGEAPHFPGRKPPGACTTIEKCIEGVTAGCEGGNEGDACGEFATCKAGLACTNHVCTRTETSAWSSTEKVKLNWIGLWGQIDLLVVTGSDRVCTNASDSQFACYLPGGARYQVEPAVLAGTNAISGGIGPSGRLLVSYDRQFSRKLPLSAGIRLGVGFGGQPESAVGGEVHPHVEGRLAYHFLGNAFEVGRVRPYAFAGGGLGRTDYALPVAVCEPGAPDPTATCAGSVPGGGLVALTSFFLTGTGFVNAGAGAIYAVVPNFGVAAEVGLVFMVPTFGFVLAPRFGPVVAF